MWQANPPWWLILPCLFDHPQGLSADLAQLVVKPARGSLARGVTPCRGAEAALAAARRLAAAGDAATGLVVEPFLSDAVQWSCVVVEGSAGPVALLPAEVEVYDVEKEIFRWEGRGLD